MRKLYGLIFSKRLLPEVVQFEDQQELHRHLEAATSTPRSILATLALAAWILLVVFLSRTTIPRQLGISPWIAQAVLQPVAMLAGFYWLYNYGLRRPLQQRLRAALREKGVPICLHCGYDLRGQTELRCSECNTPFPAELLREGE